MRGSRFWKVFEISISDLADPHTPHLSPSKYTLLILRSRNTTLIFELLRRRISKLRSYSLFRLQHPTNIVPDFDESNYLEKTISSSCFCCVSLAVRCVTPLQKLLRKNFAFLPFLRWWRGRGRPRIRKHSLSLVYVCVCARSGRRIFGPKLQNL